MRAIYKITTVYTDGRSVAGAMEYNDPNAAESDARRLFDMIVRADTDRFVDAIRAGKPGNSAKQSGVARLIVITEIVP